MKSFVVVPEVGIGISLEDGWSIAPPATPHSWAAYRGGADVETASQTLYVSTQELAQESLAAHSRALMQRHVGKDRPLDEIECGLGGLPALRFEWSDGASWVVTWFAAREPHHVSRVEYAQTVREVPGISTSIESAQQTVESLEWLSLSP